MKVCLGSPGRFWTFDLGRQLDRRGLLQRLYTAYPRIKVDADLRSKCSTRPARFLARAAMGRLRLERAARRMDLEVMRGFDAWVADRMEPCDVFHCLSGFGLAAHRAARSRYGAVNVCDRGSCHILEQDRLLREEYELAGIPFNGIDPQVVDREMEEYEFCDAITVPSSFAERSFWERDVASAKVRRVSFGIDLGLFYPEPHGPEPFRILFVGRIGIQKGIGYLLEAAAEWARAGVVEIWMVGDVEPEVRPLLRRYEGSFTYWGHVPRAQLRQYYSKASVLVLPSIQEGLALVLAQAMACGLPVVASDHSGAPDLVNDGVEGFVVPIRDVAALREKIDVLRRNPELRERMSRAALRRAEDLNGWDAYGDAMLGVYRALVGSA